MDKNKKISELLATSKPSNWKEKAKFRRENKALLDLNQDIAIENLIYRREKAIQVNG